MSWLRDALRGLRTPSELSAYDPVYREWASQSGHVLLGLLTAGLALREGGDALDALWTAAVVWGAWEAMQIVRALDRSKLWLLVRGSLVDLAHNGCGLLWALALMAGWPLWPALLASVAALVWAGSRVRPH